MPELPEVEIVRQSLDKKIKQKKVKKVIIRNRNLRIKIPSKFNKVLENEVIKKVSRFSKYLIINLSNNKYCLIHLGMSGTIHLINLKNKNYFSNLSFYNSPFLPQKHNHIEIIFDKFKIIYNDPRRFGFFQLIKNSKSLKKRFIHLGPEPFDKRFNIKYFTHYVKNKKKNIKDLLIDQKFVSGIGNIYASEILYSSKINPFTPAKNLKKSQLKKIIKNSKEILNRAIKEGGSTIRDFKNTTGDIGQFQKKFRVYGRDKKNCKRLNCVGTIDKIIQSNRSTFYCKICQK